MIDCVGLYKKYGDELRGLTFKLRGTYHRMVDQDYITGFSDIEGEILYMLIRERKPKNVIEISPNAGWSSNYILAALEANDYGSLHSFEILEKINGNPTRDVIRENTSKWDNARQTAYIGDATTRIQEFEGDIDFLLIDSCHEAWFASWYIRTLFPRCKGTIFIQDIAFVDALENSSEAIYVWDYLGARKIPVVRIGEIERQVLLLNERGAQYERSFVRSNSVVFDWPQTATEELAYPARLESQIDESTYLLGEYRMANRHRNFLELVLGETNKFECRRYTDRAIGSVIMGDRPQQVKGLVECLEWSIINWSPKLFLQTACLMVFEPRCWRKVLKSMFYLPRKIAVGLIRAAGK